MPRPPKRINPGSHRTADRLSGSDRVFKKGRFLGRAKPDVVDESTVVELDEDGTATVNASFASASDQKMIDAPVDHEVQPVAERTITSKYEARPSSGAPGSVEDEAREDVVVDLTEAGVLERKVVVDLTKLPPVDVSKDSDTFYVRHSSGWPTEETG